MLMAQQARMQVMFRVRWARNSAAFFLPVPKYRRSFLRFSRSVLILAGIR